MNKTYNSAPLPFMGQKRRFVPDFKKALKTFDQATIFVDLFGGSGLLSHVTKSERPNARVIYNDYDDYHKRLEHIDRTNVLLADLRQIASKTPADKKLSQIIKEAVLQRVELDDTDGFVDYITLSSSLLFSMKYVNNFDELKKATMYNRIKKDNYNCDGYLDGLEVVKCDYRKLFHQFKDNANVVFIVDPPYLSTEAGTYKSYWKLADYLDVLQVLNNVSYIYFTSDKSAIIELLAWIDKNLNADNPFKGAAKIEILNRMNYQAEYKDIMLYRQSNE